MTIIIHNDTFGALIAHEKVMKTRINEENRKCKTNNVHPRSQSNKHVENTMNNELRLRSNIYILPYSISSQHTKWKLCNIIH